MNNQELIKQYAEYGIAPAEISKELGIPLHLVNSALVVDKKATTDIKAESLRYKRKAYDKMQANDKEKPMYEILYQYGSREVNRLVKRMGMKAMAQYTGYKYHDIIALKYHFGYHEVIPDDAIENISYFSTKLKREVDNRDNRVCIRCNRAVSDKNMRYHKISHPGPMTIDNCATMCLYCRSVRILKHYDADYTTFQGMTNMDFKVWIDKNDKFMPSNRTYPPGFMVRKPK